MITTFFTKAKLPEELPEGLETLVNKLKKTKSKEECLIQTHKLLSMRFRGYSIKTYTHLHELFRTNIHSIWNKEDDFIHCTTMNYLVRIALVKSGWFCEENISQHWTMVWYVSPHQYLRVRIAENKFLFVDLWGAHNGIPLGEYAHGFWRPPKNTTIVSEQE